jgi:hypothetical protein
MRRLNIDSSAAWQTVVTVMPLERFDPPAFRQLDQVQPQLDHTAISDSLSCDCAKEVEIGWKMIGHPEGALRWFKVVDVSSLRRGVLQEFRELSSSAVLFDCTLGQMVEKERRIVLGENVNECFVREVIGIACQFRLESLQR